MITLGTWALWSAAVGSAGTLGACLISVRNRRWLGPARWGLAASAGSLLLASGALLAALGRGDLRLAYVAEHTASSLQLWLRLGAFWAGQEGSLLLWALFLAIVAAVVAGRRRHMVHAGEPVTLGIFATLNLFCAALLIAAADPFRLLATPPTDGHGLHPQLQYWAMVLHPPLLFAGYAAFAAPMAITCGALVAGRSDNTWVAHIRRWALFAWMCLGAGIALGAWWAYVELGWGGYWAWDPVENASLMPWLTGTALIHSIAVHQHRGVLKMWTAGLSLLTFGLCVFGTYITRSGAFASMHAFGQSTVGTWFLGLLVVGSTGGTGLLVWRRRLLRSEANRGGLSGREAATLAANILFMAMGAVTLIGTVLPLASGWLAPAPVSVNPSFYARVFGPLGLGVAGLMALAPLLTYRRSAGAESGRKAAAPGICALIAVTIAALGGVLHPAVLACVAICTFAWLAIVIDFVRSARSYARTTGFRPVEAAARMMDGNHRRYGGQVAHAGLLLVIIGLTGSKLFSQAATARVSAGETLGVSRYTLRFDGVHRVRTDNYIGAEASLVVFRDGRECGTLRPQQRLLDRGGETATRVAILSSWREDLYVALLGWERGGELAVVRAQVNPLVTWIWIGAVSIAAGAGLALLPRLMPQPRDFPIPEQRPERRRRIAPEGVRV